MARRIQSAEEQLAGWCREKDQLEQRALGSNSEPRTNYPPDASDEAGVTPTPLRQLSSACPAILPLSLSVLQSQNNSHCSDLSVGFPECPMHALPRALLVL